MRLNIAELSSNDCQTIHVHLILLIIVIMIRFFLAGLNFITLAEQAILKIDLDLSCYNNFILKCLNIAPGRNVYSNVQLGTLIYNYELWAGVWGHLRG